MSATAQALAQASAALEAVAALLQAAHVILRQGEQALQSFVARQGGEAGDAQALLGDTVARFDTNCALIWGLNEVGISMLSAANKTTSQALSDLQIRRYGPPEDLSLAGACVRTLEVVAETVQSLLDVERQTGAQIKALHAAASRFDAPDAVLEVTEQLFARLKARPPA